LIMDSSSVLANRLDTNRSTWSKLINLQVSLTSQKMHVNLDAKGYINNFSMLFYLFFRYLCKVYISSAKYFNIWHLKCMHIWLKSFLKQIFKNHLTKFSVMCYINKFFLHAQFSRCNVEINVFKNAEKMGHNLIY
jgi:hypothetical protein